MLIVSDPPITLLLSPRNSNTLIIHFHATRYARRRLVMEVNNGRLAMIGIFGFLAEGAVPGSVPLLKGLIPGYSGNVMIPFEGDFKWFPGNMIADAADAVSTASY